MSAIEDIEKAIERLPPAELVQLRAWFDAFDAKRFDDKIANDAASGKLDALAEQALKDYRTGHAREL